MREIRTWYTAQRIQRTLAALEKNGFQTSFASTRDEALEKVLSLVPQSAKVGVGGSVTLREISLIDVLTMRGNTVSQHWHQPEQNVVRIMREELNSDVYLASSNAVTEDGRLINIDMTGNRVAAMIFGPPKVILVIGVNKIVKDVDEGIKRVKNVATPMNAHRLGLKVPCASTGVCTDCDAEDRLCRVTTIIEKRPSRSDISVILVGEELGF